MKAKPNELFENLSGTFGELTVSNRSGQLIVHKKTNPKNANTAPQKATRKKFIHYTSKWAALTDQQRNQWNQTAREASANPHRFGVSQKVNGWNLYLKCNINLSLLDTPVELHEPVPEFPQPAPHIRQISLTTDTITVELAEPVPAGHTIIIRATPLNAGQTTNTKRLFQAGTIPEGSQTADITETFRARFGEPTNQKKIQIQIYAIHNQSGYASPRLEALSNTLP